MNRITIIGLCLKSVYSEKELLVNRINRLLEKSDKMLKNNKDILEQNDLVNKDMDIYSDHK